MDTLNIDHIGIAVANIEMAISLYKDKFGMVLEHQETLQDRGIKVAFLRGTHGTSSVELMEPINHEDQNNTVAKFLKTKGQGMHHLAIQVNNIRGSLKELADQGFSIIDKEPRKGARGHLVAFVHPKSVMGILLELVEQGHH